jgi:aminopeptidase N
MKSKTVLSIAVPVSLAALLLPFVLFAQPLSKIRPAPVLDHAWRADERQAGSFLSQNYLPVYQEVDALHYTIEAEFNLGASYPSTAYLDATTTISGQAKAEALNELVVDLYDNITINSLTLNGTPFTDYTRYEDKIWMDLSADPLAPGEPFEIEVDYYHLYGTTYQGLMFRLHCATPPCPSTATPGICSVDQPYLSPGWWPCFNVPGDKATADIYMTYPDWMTGVSNGVLQSEVNNGDGTKTSHWLESHPLYSDVLSVAMTDYISWTDTYVSPLDATTMTIYYYAFPEDAAKAMVDFAVTKDAMEYFAQIYGEYPFIDEKYALVETLNSMGSLENQTATSLTYRATRAAVNWDVIVHELAHQWWGDWVTCATWNHLWLHEGLATYSEILFHENQSGDPAGPFMEVNYDDGLYNGELADTVYVEDEDLLMPFVPTGAVYEKGSWVFHMLRYMLGSDTDFFDTLKAFGAAHADANAATDDMKSAMEATYGSSLTDFFNQWLYTPYRPVYAFTYENSGGGGGAYTVDVNLRQTQGHPVQDISATPLRDYYIMPVEFTVHYTDATSETFGFTNNQRNQSFQIPVTKQPDYTVFDEDVHILKLATAQVADNDGVFGDGDFSGVPGDNLCAGGTTEDCDDNCTAIPNGPDAGTCVKTVSGVKYGTGVACTSDLTCQAGERCDLAQGDCNANGMGDVCSECYADITGTTRKVDVSDLVIMKGEFNQPCPPSPCSADLNKSGKVDLSDLVIMKGEFMRSNCPVVP